MRVWGREGGGCEGVGGERGEEGEENDVKRGKVSEKEHRTFC